MRTPPLRPSGTLFQQLNGVIKMVDYLAPHGPNAPYATHIARTLPAVMDHRPLPIQPGAVQGRASAAGTPLHHPQPVYGVSNQGYTGNMPMG